MKPLAIAAAALAVFFLVLGMIMSAPAPAPAAAMDRCMMCHPQAHPDNWTKTLHVTDIKTGKVAQSECTTCHSAGYCVQCHAEYQAMVRAQQAAADQAAAAAKPAKKKAAKARK